MDPRWYACSVAYSGRACAALPGHPTGPYDQPTGADPCALARRWTLAEDRRWGGSMGGTLAADRARTMGAPRERFSQNPEGERRGPPKASTPETLINTSLRTQWQSIADPMAEHCGPNGRSIKVGPTYLPTTIPYRYWSGVPRLVGASTLPLGVRGLELPGTSHGEGIPLVCGGSSPTIADPMAPILAA